MFPTEIEADFAKEYPSVDLLDWHRGTRDERGALLLSSRRLIVLMGGLSARGNYKTSLRGGYLCELDLVAYETYNEIAKLRASYYAVKGGEDAVYEPFEFIDPVIRIEQAIEEELREDEGYDSAEQLYRDMGL